MYNESRKRRRTLSFFIDILFVILFDVIIRIIFYNSILENYTLLFSIPLYFIVLPLITKGQTIGKKVVKIKISGVSKELTWYRLLLRNIILIFFIIFPFLWLNLIERLLNMKNKSKIFLIIRIVFLIIQLINIVYYLKSALNKENIFLYEKITNTKNISTISVDKNLSEEEKSTECVEKEKTEKEKSTISVDKKKKRSVHKRK